MNDVAGKHVTHESKLAELRARKAEREAAEVKESELLEIEALELEEKYASMGKRGVDYDVITTRKGCFVLRKPEYITARKFNAAKEKTEDEVITFVAPAIVHPDQSTARLIMQDHAGIAWTCAGAMQRMYSAEDTARAKK